MKTIILDRADINNPFHPRMWEMLCDDLGLGPTCDCGTYPDEIELKVASARDADEEQRVAKHRASNAHRVGQYGV